MLINRAIPDEPGIHPTVARMRDIILGKAADGEPTFKTDLVEFSDLDITQYFAAAKRLADKQVVRQVGDDNAGFESRHQLLTRAAGLTLGLMPSEAAIHDRLRANGLSNKEIADLWPDLLATAAQAFVTLRTGNALHAQVQ